MLFNKRKRILVLDDEPEIVDFIAKLLRSWKYEVNESRCLGEALSQLKRHRFDLIISDIDISGESGYDLVEVMRECGMKTPLVLISGAVNIYDDNDCSSDVYKSIFSYLEKPFSAQELKAIVEEAIAYKKSA